MIEEWRAVVGYEGIYEVSSLGRVRSITRKCRSPSSGGERRVPGKILKPTPWGPYLSVTLYRDGKGLRQNIQWLVIIAFVGARPLGMEVCHNDSDHHNNRASNLRYDTRAGNFSDKLKNGTHQRGENSGCAKLTQNQVNKIRSLKGVRTQQSIADEFLVTQAHIGRILNNKVWIDAA